MAHNYTPWDFELDLWLEEAPFERTWSLTKTNRGYRVQLYDSRASLDGCGNNIAGMATSVDLTTAVMVAVARARKRMKGNTGQ
jgi:hypothetical protein